MKKIFESKVIYRIENELILNVQTFRTDRGWSQRVLSGKMGLVEAFVGNYESTNQDERYNVQQIGILKRVLKFISRDILFPNGIPNDEQIIIKYKEVSKKKVDGTESRLMENEVIEIVVVDAEAKAQGN